MTRWIVLIGVLMIPAAAQTAAEKEAVTLEEAVRIALERHPDVGQAQASAEALKGKIREVRAQAFPEVTLNAGASRWRDPSFLNASGFDSFPQGVA